MTKGNSLPDGWVWTTLEQIRQLGRKTINPKRTPEQTYELYSVPALDTGCPEIVLGKDIGSSKQIVEEETVLVCKINPRINRVWVVGDFSKHPKIASTEWIQFPKVEGISPSYLCYYMQRNDFRDHLAQNVSGVGGSLMRARISALQDYGFPLPPFSEQKRIVAKIEELFTQLDAGVAALERVRAGLKRYNVSLLKNACGGNFVSAKLGNGKLESTKLPDGWTWTTIGEVAENLDRMRIPVSKKEREKRQGPYPYYGANGQVGWINDFIFDEPLVLVVEDETFTGREKPFSYKITGKSWVNNHAHVLRTKSDILDTDYLNFSLSYYPFTPMTTGTTGRKKLTKSVLMGAPYALPPLTEQQRIVSELDRRFSVMEQVETAVEVGLKRAERLRQAILKRAFEGTLV